MTCVAECPSDPDFYAYNHATKGPLCILYCPSLYFRHTPTRECLTACPGPTYFRDLTTMRCVLDCPAYYFAQSTGQICVVNCSINNQYGYNRVCYSVCPNNTNADPTTNLCVEVCPFGYFAENGVCSTTCTVGFADPFTKICASVCSPDYYALLVPRICIQNCQPQFKILFNQTCSVACPRDADLSLNYYMDNNSYSCVNVCLPTWYADNTTGYCQQTCSSALFADNSTGRCVSQCPSTPDYYGYNRICYFPCPSNTLFA